MKSRVLGVLALVVATAPVSAEEEDSKQPAPKCSICKGWGEEDCSACKGTRFVHVSCDKCRGTLQEDCLSCKNGQQPCDVCGGKGFRVVIAVRGGTSRYPCAPSRNCPTCRGRSTVDCKKCRRTGVQKDPCTTCKQSGRQDCTACGGKGTFDVAEIPPPPPDFTSPEEIASFEARVQAALEALKAFARKLEALRVRRKKALEKDAQLESQVEASRKALGGDQALRNESTLLDEKWSACRRARESAAERLEEAEKEVLACSQAASALREMARRLGQPVTAKYKDVAELPAIEATAERCRRAASMLESELDDQDRALKSCAKGLEESEAAARNHVAKKEAALREKALLQAAYGRFKDAAEAAARRTGLPAIETVLHASSISARSLRAQVIYHDDAAPVAEDAGAAEPTDSALENLPRFISLLFSKVPEATRIEVTVQGRILGDTGHEERRPIQSFTMERKRWTELVTGQWKDKWREILSRSNPTPAYPRTVRSVLHEGWPLVLLLVVLAFSLGVLYVARSRMFQ